MKKYNGETKGYLHSVETAGMVDGPGIRYVAFFAGCNLRCLYCHNPDTWNIRDGHEVTVETVLRDIKKYRSYLRFSGGGVTLTGGEPFMQPGFLTEFLKACKKAGFHTALDTSGFAPEKAAREALAHTDLLMLDLKSIDPFAYEKLTAVPLAPTLKTLEIAAEMKVPTWIRFVLVPGLTDKEKHLLAMREYLEKFPNVEKIEVLPFHKLGEYKWEKLGLNYQLKETQEPTKEALQKAKELLDMKKA